MILPTDTTHLRPETRQYELFNRPLGHGIPRRQITVFTIAAAVWWTLLGVIGIDPLWTLGPMAYLVPVVAFSFTATRRDASGRMAMLAWYDWLLAGLPRRRARVTNPLLPAAARTRHPFRVSVTVELHPGGPETLPRLVGRGAGRRADAGVAR